MSYKQRDAETGKPTGKYVYQILDPVTGKRRTITGSNNKQATDAQEDQVKARLKSIVGEKEIDIQILKEALRGK